MCRFHKWENRICRTKWCAQFSFSKLICGSHSNRANQFPSNESNELNRFILANVLGRLPDYKVVKAVPVIVLDTDIPREPKNSKFHPNPSTFYAAFGCAAKKKQIPFCILLIQHISVFTWGRRMSKKFELLRRNDSRKLHDDGAQMVRKSCPSASASADILNGRNVLSLRSMPKHGLVTEEIQTPPAVAGPVIAAAAATTTTPAAVAATTTTSSSTNGGYSFKTFFHRIGSTGMLSRSNNQNSSKQLSDNNSARTLYRSSSTSQLNTPSYVKGEYMCNNDGNCSHIFAFNFFRLNDYEN